MCGGSGLAKCRVTGQENMTTFTLTPARGLRCITAQTAFPKLTAKSFNVMSPMRLMYMLQGHVAGTAEPSPQAPIRCKVPPIYYFRPEVTQHPDAAAIV